MEKVTLAIIIFALVAIAIYLIEAGSSAGKLTTTTVLSGYPSTIQSTTTVAGGGGSGTTYFSKNCTTNQNGYCRIGNVGMGGVTNFKLTASSNTTNNQAITVTVYVTGNGQEYRSVFKYAFGLLNTNNGWSGSVAVNLTQPYSSLSMNVSEALQNGTPIPNSQINMMATSK